MLPFRIFGSKTTMPIRRKASDAGIFGASELTLLGRVSTS